MYDRLKALVIGFGSIGKRHIENLSKISNTEILVYTKRDAPLLKKNKCKRVDSLKEGIKENPDFGIIANVTNQHIKTALKLAENGIPFFCEKPLSNNLRDIKKLQKLVLSKKLKTLMGCNFRFHPCIKKIRELIRENQIGRIISVHADNGSFLPDWQPDEDYRQSYAARDDLGGGVVLTCIHELDYLYWFFGSVKEVFSITGKFSDLDVSCTDFSSILLKFTNNIIAEIQLNYFQKPPSRGCKVLGTNGTILWDSDKNTVKIFRTKTKKWKTIMKIKKFNHNNMYYEELKHFLNCLKNKEKSINDLNQGYETLKITLSTIKSGKYNKPILVK